LKKKTILINLLNFRSSNLAGAGVFARNLLKHWLQTEHSKNDFIILHSSSIDVNETFGIERSWYSKAIVKDITGFIPRIAFEQFLLPFYLRGINVLSGFFGKTRLVITIHDIIPFFIPQKYPGVRRIYVKWISIAGARRAHRVITVSECSRKDIAEIANVSREKVSVVYNFFHGSPEVSKVSEKFFLCIATVEPGKNVENTLKSFKKFIDRFDSDYKFYWAGGVGWIYTKEQLNALVEENGLKGKFEFLGFISEEQKTDLLRRCAAVVYLSLYEGFGLPLLEGMRFGKPILTSNVSSLPEVVGEAGVLCEPADIDGTAAGMNEIVSNRDKYTPRIAVQLTKFDKQIQLEKFLSIVDEQLR
jgi:glycosyltransferase involved in cell wall biosynthesis